jgi:ABC-type multidrug transport system ATPase subunit
VTANGGGPLFSCQAARVEAENGSILIDSLTFETDHATIALVGAWEPFVALLTGSATLVSGRAQVFGLPPDRAVFDNRLALSLREPPLPDKPTALEHLTASARLLGLGKRDARREALRSLERLGLGLFAKRRLQTLGDVERRALGLAHVLLGEPQAILVERPFEALDDHAADRLAVLLDEAGKGRKMAVVSSAPAGTGPERRYVERAEHVVALAGSAVVASGPPGDVLGPSRRYVVWATREARAFEALLEERGGARVVERVGGTAHHVGGEDAARLVIELPEGAGPELLIEAAVQARAPLVELLPVALAVRAGPG